MNKKEVKVVISATYNENGTLNTYEVTVDGVKTGSYTAVYNETNITELEKITLNKIGLETYDFKNTQISKLPSTGGMGTYIFTIVGIAVIAVAAGMVVVSRKKKNS